jgi:hypothetical protein
MRLLLAILLLASSAQGALVPASGTTALYLASSGELVDVTGNFGNLVETGTVPENSSPVPCSAYGTYTYGTFTATRYYSLPSDLLTAMNGYSAYSIELCLYLNSMSNSPVPFSNTSNFFIQVNTLGAVRWSSAGGFLGPGPNDVATGNSYTILCTYDGTNKKVWLNGNIYLNAVQDASIASLSALRIGLYSGSTEAVNGNISWLRIMNVAATPPVTDTLSGASPTNNRNIRLQNMMRLRLGWLNPFTVLASKARAIEQNGPKATRIYQSDWLVKDKADKGKRDKKTPTVTPVCSATLTPVPTATRTPTP